MTLRKYISGRNIAAVLMVLLVSCVKPFVPPATQVNYDFLVVDGNISIGSAINIHLSRTKFLTDTAAVRPENNAVVNIEDEAGGTYILSGDLNGNYGSNTTFLSVGGKYRLSILTQNGKQYYSDFVEAKQTPQIDSVEWHQDDDIFIYVNTHDPQNNTRYYRWDYVETYEYHSAFDSHLDFRNGQVVFLDPSEYRTICFRTQNSANVLVGTSIALSEDAIKHALINTVPNDNSKISERYSILVRQYALTPQAYQYWTIVKQNSQESGGIFDPQPSQLKGNIRCVNDTLEPVIGYISASTITEKRIFIKNNELNNRVDPSTSVLCKEIFIAPEDAAQYLSDGINLPAYFITNGPLAIVPRFCVDCRMQGGTLEKPSFW